MTTPPPDIAQTIAELERGLVPFVDNEGDCVCNRCQNHFHLRGREPTAFCNDCAHAVIEEILPALLAVAQAAESVLAYVHQTATNDRRIHPRSIWGPLDQALAALERSTPSGEQA